MPQSERHNLTLLFEQNQDFYFSVKQDQNTATSYMIQNQAFFL